MQAGGGGDRAITEDERRVALEFLRRQGPFVDLPAEELDRLSRRLCPLRASAGEVLMRQGEHGDDVLIVRGGELEVLREDPSGERELAVLGPGSLVGEIAVLTGMARTATIRARGVVEAYRAPGDDVREVVRRHRALLHRVTELMEARHAPRRIARPRVLPAPDDVSSVILEDEARGTYVRLDRQALPIWDDLDGDLTVRDLALRHFERTGTHDARLVLSTIAALQAAGFVTAPRVAADTTDGRLLRALDAIFAPRFEVGDADGLVERARRMLAPLMTGAAAVAAVVVGTAGLAAALPLLRAASPLDFGLGGIAVAFVGLLVAGVGHEAAHALAAKTEGARLGRAGIGLFWFAPVVYVDTSATWAIPRWARIRVNVAGPLFNLALAGALGLLAHLVSDTARDALVWLALTNAVMVAFNLSPLLEFDGYYVLADLTGTNALRRKAMRSVFKDVGRPRLPASRAEAGWLAYVVACILYTAAMSVIAVAGAVSLLRALLPAAAISAAGPILEAATGSVLLLLLGLPIALEAIEARRAKAADPRALAEALERRVSKTDLSAALGVRTATVDIRPPSETIGR